MKVVALVSGGKDSCYAMMRCIDYGHEIVALANLMPLDDSVDELDSYMYQTVGHQIVVSYAECMGLPLFRRRIQGCMRHPHLSYTATPGDEVEDLFLLLNEVKQQIPSVSAVSSGAIASDYQRLRVENICARLGLVSLAYLWKQDQTFLLDEMIRRHIIAITIKVAAIGLNPEKHLGKELGDLQSHLLKVKELYGINVCGEGGEYETLTLDCPLFTNARIVLDNYQVILHSPDSIASVGVLHPLAYHLEQKHDLSSDCRSESNDVVLKKGACICEVNGDFLPESVVKYQPMELAPDFYTTKKLNMCISTTQRDTFSIGCGIQNSSRTSEGLQEDLVAVLTQIESELSKYDFSWANVLYIHLYISDMKQFAVANEVYVQFITERRCHLGVPSRSTIELPLMHVGLGNAYAEVLVSNEQDKRVLHVQSISSWAPSCIGPYSQATLHKEILYMAGQLGLDPPTMMLCSGGPLAEMEQALKNCEAVANCFNCSLASSAISVVVYCSASLTSRGRTEIQSSMDHFLGCQVSDLLKDDLLRVCDPIVVYILAPNLPKGALVEVKPVLHTPQNGEDEVQTVEPHISSQVMPDYWSFETSEWLHSCFQRWSIHGKIFSAVLSITKEVTMKICSISDDNLTGFSYSTFEKHVKEVIKLCIYLLDKFLSEDGFSWGDLKNLRFYYRTEIALTADKLSIVISEVFNEFAEVSTKFEVGQVPKFNLLPVLGSGRSASMDDLMTCEIFASKA